MDNKDMPAFPQTAEATGRIDAGMEIYTLSKREWVAAIAMQGMLSNPKLDIESTRAEIIARDAVAQADALIAELSKTQL